MSAIYRREIRGLFSGLFGWSLVAIGLLVGGWYTLRCNIASMTSDFAYALENVTVYFLLTMPFLAARCFTAENANGNIFWIRSLPVSAASLVLGKYFAALTVFAIPTAVYVLFPPLFANYGTVSYGSDYIALFGYFLLGAAWLAICCLVSSLMRRKWVAIVICLLSAVTVMFGFVFLSAVFSVFPLVGLLLCVMGFVAWGIVLGIRKKQVLTGVLMGGIPTAVLTVCYFVCRSLFVRWIPFLFRFIALFDRYSGFGSGYFDLSVAVLYVGVIFLAMFFAVNYPLSIWKKGGKNQ